MDPVPGTARLFVALDVDDATRVHLSDLGRALAAATGARAVPAANLHLTLCFMGAVDRASLPALSRQLEACSAQAATPLRGVVRTVEGPPGQRRPRLLAARIDDPDGGAVAGLWRCVQEACARVAGTVPDERLWPHITLVRGRGPLCRPSTLAHSRHEHPFVFDRMSLYHSHMGHGVPPSYVPVAVFPLGSNRTR